MCRDQSKRSSTISGGGLVMRLRPPLEGRVSDPSRLAALLRGFLRVAHRVAYVVSRVDQRDVGQGLGEVAGQPTRPGVIFFRQQAEIIGDRDNAVEQRLGAIEVAYEHVD